MTTKLAGFLALLVLLLCAGPTAAATSPVVLTHTLSASTENGMVNTLSLHVENVGEKALSGIALSFVARPPFLKAVRPVTIAQLRPHESTDVSLHLVSPVRVKPAQLSSRTLLFLGKCLEGKGRALLFPTLSHSGGQRRFSSPATPGNLPAKGALALVQSGPGAYLSQWGARFHLPVPAALALDSSGNVYVAGDNMVQKFDSSGNFLFSTGFLTPQGQPFSPEGVAVDSGGSFYVTDSYGNKVQKFDSSGNFLTSWGGPGAEAGQFNNPLGVALDASGNVYVSDAGNARIQKFDSSGTFLTAWGLPGSGYVTPAGIAVDTTGNVYVSDRYNSMLHKFDAGGKLLISWEITGVSEDLFNNPSGIAVDGAGNVYVANSDAIQIFDAGGHLTKSWGSYGSNTGQFSIPLGVALDGSGNVYVADTYNDRIQKFDGSGRFLSMWASYGWENGTFHVPTGVAVDGGNNVYVADSFNDRVQKFDGSGNFLTTWGSSGSENGQFSNPVAVATDGSGNVYVADALNNRIQKFDGYGNFLATFGLGELRPASGPVGIAVDKKGNFYVADIDYRVVKKFDKIGTLIWESHGSPVLGSFFPVAVAVDGAGNLYVSDTVTGTVQKFDSGGNYLSSYGSFKRISGVAVDERGNLYVIDSGGGVLEPGGVRIFDPSGNERGSFGSYGSGNGEVEYPTALAVGKTGDRIYLADTGNNRIEVFEGFGAAATATRLAVSAPASATAGTPFSFTVSALDALGKTATGYAGIVHFSTGETLATLPADAALTNGTGSFRAILRTAGSQSITASDTATTSLAGTSHAIAVSAPAPDLTIAMTHSGSFQNGQHGTYTITVKNGGSGPTTGRVTVTDALPKGLTKPVLSGTGWSCTKSPLACSTASVLTPGAGYPPITLTVQVAGNAPASVTNSATVSGAGEVSGSNNTASDLTAIKRGRDHGHQKGRR